MTQKALNPIIRVKDELTFSPFNPVSSLGEKKKKNLFQKTLISKFTKYDGKFNSSEVFK